MNRNIVFSLTIGLILFAALEGASYVIGNFVFPTSVVFRPSFSAAEKADLQVLYRQYLNYRDPATGWPFKEPRQTGRDESGSRLNPHSPYSAGTSNCVSIYGDSYTWSDEVTEDFAWSTVLSELLDCRVGNFGVGGFGTDQAYMRYLSNTGDQAPIVFLNHQSENIMRNVTQFRALTNGYSKGITPLNFKPRFIMDETGTLQLVGIPTFDSEEYPDVLINPGNYLPHEYFLPGGETGLVRLSFPYSWTLIRALGHFHIQAWLADKPWFMDFYEPDHPAHGLEITTAILLAFKESAQNRGQTPIITVIPNGLDLLYFIKYGVWPYQNLLDQLTGNGVDVLNFGIGIIERLGNNDPCSLFDNCSSHFNELGYRYIAEIAYAELAARGLLPKPSAPLESAPVAD